MRTTLMIEDALLRRAKEHAARRGLTLSALVERALREELRPTRGSSAREAEPVYRITTFGGPESRHLEPEEIAAVLLEDDVTSLGRREGGERR